MNHLSKVLLHISAHVNEQIGQSFTVYHRIINVPEQFEQCFTVSYSTCEQ